MDLSTIMIQLRETIPATTTVHPLMELDWPILIVLPAITTSVDQPQSAVSGNIINVE